MSDNILKTSSELSISSTNTSGFSTMAATIGLVADKICRCSTLPRVLPPPHRSTSVLWRQKAVTVTKTATVRQWPGAHVEVHRASRTRTSNWTITVMGKRQRSSTPRLTGNGMAARSRMFVATARTRRRSVQRYGN